MGIRLALSEELTIGDSSKTGSPGFSSLSFLLVDDDEEIIVLDNKEMAISIFDRAGRFVRKFGSADKARTSCNNRWE